MKQIISCTRRVLRLCAAALLLFAAVSPAHAQLTFVFTYGPSMGSLFGTDAPTATAITVATTDAGAKWSSLFSDPITLRIGVDLDATLPSSVFAAAYSVAVPMSFTSVKGSLVADASSSTDLSAIGALQPGPKIEAITQDTTGPGVSPEIRLGGATTGTWNSTLSVTRPNLKALGLLLGTDGAPGADGMIKINTSKVTSGTTFDYTRAGGITPGLFDFTGIMIHELGHLMGFFSGVDEVDYAGDGAHPADLSGSTIFSVLDLYRYRSDTLLAPSQPLTGAVNDWRYGPPAGPSEKPYFSIDGGVTVLAPYSTGAVNGDGKQASHFGSSVSGAIMNPGFGPGVEVNPGSLDVIAMDAIGWNTVPEPATVFLLLGVLAFSFLQRRRAACAAR